MSVASLGYLAEGSGAILAPGSGDFLATLILILATPGELVFTFWLLIKGGGNVGHPLKISDCRSIPGNAPVITAARQQVRFTNAATDHEEGCDVQH